MLNHNVDVLLLVLAYELGAVIIFGKWMFCRSRIQSNIEECSHVPSCVTEKPRSDFQNLDSANKWISLIHSASGYSSGSGNVI